MKQEEANLAANELASLLTFDVAAFPKEGVYDFAPVKDDVFSALSLTKLINPPNLFKLSDKSLVDIRVTVRKLAGSIGRIKGFDPRNEGNPNDAYERIVAEIKDSYNNYLSVIAPLLTILKNDTDLDINLLKARVEGELGKVDVIVKQAADSQKSLNNALEIAKTYVKDLGVAQQAWHFEKEAEDHQLQYRIWGGATLLLVLLLLVFICFSPWVFKFVYDAFFEALGDPKLAIIQVSITKLLLFGIISYGLFLCSKNFLSHKHNFIVNRQRHNALKAFDALVTASKSGDPRDIVLTHAAACIFSQQDTGYLKQSGSGAPAQTLIEMLPSFNPSKA